MSYIKSGSTTTLDLLLTDEGRRMIIEGANHLNMFQKFSLSDCDIDYRSTKKHADTSSTVNDSPQLGFIPGVTGNILNFRKAINNGYDIRNTIWATPEGNKVFEPTKKYVAVGVRQTNNTIKYYRGDLEIDCYLHDYFTLCKIFVSKYIEDNKDILSLNPTTIEESLKTYFENTLGVLTDTDYETFLNTLSSYGVGQYLDFWDEVKVYNGNSFKTESVKLVPEKDFTYYNGIALAGGAFIRNGGRGQNTGMDFSGTFLKGLKQASPFSLMFSPHISEDPQHYKTGAGNAGIGFQGFDIGYLNCGGIGSWNTTGEPYPTFIMNSMNNGWSNEETEIQNIFVGFVSSVELESTIPLTESGFGNSGYGNIHTTIPTSRLVLNPNSIDNGPTYYPIKLKRLTKDQGSFIGINNNRSLGTRITLTTHPTDTFGLLLSSLEYSSNWNNSQNGLASASPYFNISPTKDNGEQLSSSQVAAQTQPYYTLVTRMMKMCDTIFTSVASQSNKYWMTDTYSGGYLGGLSGVSINEYNISIPLTFNVHSVESANAEPCKVTVRFKFNKGAVKESITYSAKSSQNYYRIFDDATFKFYGEAGEDLSSFSQDPRGHNYSSGANTTWQTSGGKALFRKVTRGQEI